MSRPLAAVHGPGRGLDPPRDHDGRGVADRRRSRRWPTPSTSGPSACTCSRAPTAAVVLGAAPGAPLVELVGDADAPARPRAEHRALPPGDPRAGPRASWRGRCDACWPRGRRFTGASDHLVSEALYLDDPEGNGIEIYRDRPREEWRTGGRRDRDGHAAARRGGRPRRAPEGAGDEGVPEGTRMGHVHLQVRDVAEAEGFYAAGWASTPRPRATRGAVRLGGRLPPPPGPEHLGHRRGAAAPAGRAGPAGLPRGACRTPPSCRASPAGWRRAGSRRAPRTMGCTPRTRRATG